MTVPDDGWNARLDAIVAEVTVERPGGAGSTLPSRDALAGAVERIRSALFAECLGPAGLDGPARRRFVRDHLEAALESLAEEVGRQPGLDGQGVARAFAARLPEIRRLLDLDLGAAVAGDPAAHDATEVLLCYAGFRALLHHRVAHELHGLGAHLVARVVSDIGRAATAIDIHPAAAIGERFFIDHGAGVVIGETAVIGHGVSLYQGVTLGARNFPVDAEGHLIRGLARHPILEDDVTVYAGASILGRVTIGKGSVIGGGVWLTRSVPPHSRIVQAAPRYDSFADGAGI